MASKPVTIKPRLVNCPACDGGGLVEVYLGADLRHARLAAGLSLREMARRSGWSATHHSDLELGRRRVGDKAVGVYRTILEEAK